MVITMGSYALQHHLGWRTQSRLGQKLPHLVKVEQVRVEQARDLCLVAWSQVVSCCMLDQRVKLYCILVRWLVCVTHGGASIAGHCGHPLDTYFIFICSFSFVDFFF